MMNLKRIFPALLVLFVLGLTFTSCEKDDMDLENDLISTENTDDVFALLGGDGDEENEGDECFTINYPIDVVVDGTTNTVNNDEELDTLLESVDDKKDIKFVFPINVTLTEDGSVVTLEDRQAARRLKKDCYGDDEDHDHGGHHDDDRDELDFTDCFEVNYPISIILTNGTTETINNDEELLEVLWGDCRDEDEDDDDENEDEEEEIELVYPITVTFTDDGTTETINNDDDLDALLEDCFDDWDDHDHDHDDDYEDLKDCFEFVFPISITLDDGTTKDITNGEELKALIREERGDFELNYPLEVKLAEDGSVLTLNNEDEFDEILDDCFDDWEEEEEDFDFTECFEVNYPIEGNTPAGVFTINNDEELYGFLERMEDDDENYNIIYPVTVTLVEDGSSKEVNSDDDVEALLEDCFD